jgi:hypothetical protein
MPLPRYALLALLGVALLVAAWMPWRDEAAAPIEPSVPVAVPALPLPSPEPAPAVPAAWPDAARADCIAPVALPPHEQALTLQRATAALSSGGDATLALLLQKPGGDDAATLAPWAAQVHDAALRSQDAQALRWAAGACAWMPQPTACRRELLQARLKAEPDNGLHWLDWLDEDPAAADDAWRGLAAARVWREQPLALVERLGRALPPALSPAQREGLLAPLREQEAAWLPPPSAALAQQCGHWGPAHAIGATCTHAQALLARADSARARAQGAELARVLGREEAAGPAPPTRCPSDQSSR